MSGQVVEELHGVPVTVLSAEGPVLGTAQDAVDLIGNAGSGIVAVPVTRLDPRFFDLSTGVAGEFVQKFVNYRVRLVVVGDIASHLAASGALRAFVAESNRRRDHWFLPDLAALAERLAPRPVS